MAKNCGTCSKAINGIDVVVCRGYCGGFFHLNECSGVTRAMQSYFTSNRKNLFWMCDNCAELFENSHFRVISNQADEKSPLNSLASAITELRTEIRQLHAKPVAYPSPAESPRWPSFDQRRGTKRPRIIETNVRAQDSCRVGSKKAEENVVSVAICKSEADNRFWLYLSKIRPDVTTEAVCEMTKANLNMENDPIVVKLVPKGKQIESLSFVSFKIGLDPLLKRKALDPETWPEGLLFREFVDYSASKFRSTLNMNTRMTPLLQPQTPVSSVTPVMDLS